MSLIVEVRTGSGSDRFPNAQARAGSLAAAMLPKGCFVLIPVANDAFRNKTGKDLYEYIDHDNFKFREGNYPAFEFNWQEDGPESMKKICPRLF